MSAATSPTPDGGPATSGPATPPRGRVADAVVPRWVRRYERAWLGRDVLAGLTVAVLLVPQGMAYAALAGMPPITGLYAALVALVVYALSGTSSHLSYGPVAIVSLLSASAVGPLAAGDPLRFAALSGLLALLVAVLHVALGLLRAGAVVDLISHPVIVGFTAAAGLVIGLTQARDLLGVDAPRSERAYEAVAGVVRVIGTTHVPTLVLGAAAVVALLVLRRLAPRYPGVLTVVAIGIVVSVTVGLEDLGVRVVGDIPSGLPRPALPAVAVVDAARLLPAAVVLALVSFAESFSIGKAVAGRTREVLDANRELVASGLANAASGLAGGFAVAGSFTRSFLSYQARARSQVAGLVAAAVVALTLLLFTAVLEPLPRAILAAIVLVTVIGLVDAREARHIVHVDRYDGMVLGVTFVATLAVGVELGLAVGIGANLLVHVARRMRPELVVLGRVLGTRYYRNVTRHETVTSDRGVILRLDGPLDFLSATAITGQLRRLAAERPELDWIVLDAGGVTGLDTTGVHALRDVRRDLLEAEVELHLVTLHAAQREVIERAGLWEELIAERCHRSIPTALAALGHAPDDPLLYPAAGEVGPSVLL